MAESDVAESKIITINSQNATRLNGSNLSNIIFDFKDVVKTLTETTTTISLQSVEMPFSIYNVDYNRNTIAIAYGVGNTNTTASLTLTEGNYNANTFRNEVVGKLSAIGINSVMEISPTTGVFRLYSTNSYTIKVLMSGTTCQRIIGLSQDTTFPPDATNPTRFNFPCNFLGIKKLSLYSDALAGNNIDSNSLGENTLINTISVNAPAWGLITYQNASLNESILRNTNINRIDLQVRDEDGFLVDFNNTDYEMTFIMRSYTEYKERMKVGNFSDLVRNERRDNAIREVLDNPIYEDAPIKETLEVLEENEKFDGSKYDDLELDILVD